jgi:hypothetical protein
MKKSIRKCFVGMLALLLSVGMVPTTVWAETTPNVRYRTHVENKGWQEFVSDGVLSGTTGENLRLEGIQIELENQVANLDVAYQTHIQNYGWEDQGDNTNWKKNGDTSGTTGESLRLEAIQIKLTGDTADQFDIWYQVHAQNMGWLAWTKNGESAGTEGFGYRLEGIKIQILSAGSSAPSGTVDQDEPFYKKLIQSPHEAITYLKQLLAQLGMRVDEEYKYTGYCNKGFKLTAVNSPIQEQPYIVSPKGSLFNDFKQFYLYQAEGDETICYLATEDEARQYLDDYLIASEADVPEIIEFQGKFEQSCYRYYGYDEIDGQKTTIFMYDVFPGGNIYDNILHQYIYEYPVV